MFLFSRIYHLMPITYGVISAVSFDLLFQLFTLFLQEKKSFQSEKSQISIKSVAFCSKYGSTKYGFN